MACGARLSCLLELNVIYSVETLGATAGSSCVHLFIYFSLKCEHELNVIGFLKPSEKGAMVTYRGMKPGTFLR